MLSNYLIQFDKVSSYNTRIGVHVFIAQCESCLLLHVKVASGMWQQWYCGIMFLSFPATVKFVLWTHDCSGKIQVSFCSHHRFPLLSMMLRDVISFIFDVTSCIARSFYSVSDSSSCLILQNLVLYLIQVEIQKGELRINVLRIGLGSSDCQAIAPIISPPMLELYRSYLVFLQY